MHKRYILLSGMRPTGPLHLGHLVGVLDNWVKLQDEYNCFFMIADWHALMSEYMNPQSIKTYTFDNVRDWLAVGIDPCKSIIFRQSDVKEHLELSMLLSVLTPISWLERCPTYKEQINQIKDRDINNYAFLGYPLLQAADILLYKAEFVPIGEDQLPHLELTREIARRFNHLYKKEIFPLPKALLTKESRLLGTDNRKMSKSYNNYIALQETERGVKQRVLSMITDPKKIKKGDPGRPSICNVYTYHQIFIKRIHLDDKQLQQIDSDCKTGKLGCVECKNMLASYLNLYLAKFKERRERYKDKDILKILNRGAECAKEKAAQQIQEIKSVMGLL
ncbi:MAG: tryptophan--tRNA ligase [Candidatus Omnitrophica bacterium]|nr:tryptophan--tRNA ligase [Candidatus Omnitrophota bacterium]